MRTRLLVGPLLAATLLVGSVSVASAAEAYPRLRQGAVGAPVKALQQLLTDKGYDSGAVDGRFGPRTRRAVLAYQRDAKLAVDGIVGPRTWASLTGTAPATPPAPPPPASTSPTVPAPVAGPPPEATWDRLATCESGGRWALNLGTGYYGGLQFTLPAWRDAGGAGYPHEATKAEQIQRATVLWQRLGWKPWPACSRRLGLV